MTTNQQCFRSTQDLLTGKYLRRGFPTNTNDLAFETKNFSVKFGQGYKWMRKTEKEYIITTAVKQATANAHGNTHMPDTCDITGCRHIIFYRMF